MALRKWACIKHDEKSHNKPSKVPNSSSCKSLTSQEPRELETCGCFHANLLYWKIWYLKFWTNIIEIHMKAKKWFGKPININRKMTLNHKTKHRLKQLWLYWMDRLISSGSGVHYIQLQSWKGERFCFLEHIYFLCCHGIHHAKGPNQYQVIIYFLQLYEEDVALQPPPLSQIIYCIELNSTVTALGRCWFNFSHFGRCNFSMLLNLIELYWDMFLIIYPLISTHLKQ